MTYILNAENPLLTNIVSPLRPSIWANLVNEVEEALIQTRLNPSKQMADTCMYACEKGDVRRVRRRRGAIVWFVKHLNLPLKVGNTQLKTVFAYTCGRVVCTHENKALQALWQILCVSWGAGLPLMSHSEVGLNTRQLHTCYVHSRAARGVWLKASLGCASHEEGFSQTENSKVNIIRFIWNWVWKTLKMYMTDF